MSVRRCVISSRAATISHICLFCLSSRKCCSSKVPSRHYAVAAKAVPKPHTSPGGSSLSTSPSSASSSSSEGVGPSPKKRIKKSGSQGGQIKTKTEKQAQEEEIRRKALATLNKSTKFIAAGLDQFKAEPTLSDLDSFKPLTPPPFGLDFVYPEATAFLRPHAPKDSALQKYDEIFNKLVDNLVTKFKKKQLVALHKQGIERPTPKGQGQPRSVKKLRTARDFAAEIVRWRWQWPYLKELVDRRTYLTSVAERIFPLKTNEFFLLLGPNGSTFRELTDQFGVTLTRVEPTKNGFDLSVKGLCYSLDQLAIMLKKRREQIITETVTPEFLGRPSNERSIYEDSLRRISKHTDALVEELENGRFQISALNPSSLNAASRLVSRTQHQLMHRPPSFIAVGETDIEQYSLFPTDVYRPNRVPLHWNSSMTLDILNLNQSTSTAKASEMTFNDTDTYDSPSSAAIFRIRKTIQNAAVAYPRHVSGDSMIPQARIDDEAKFTVRNVLEQSNFVSGVAQKQATASFGQVIFAPNKIYRTPLISPLQAPFSLSKLLQWMKNDTSKVTFIPEIPPSLGNLTISARSTFTRLVYRAVTSSSGSPSSPILSLNIKRNNQPKEYATPPEPSLVSATNTAGPDLSADLRDIFADENKGVSRSDYDYSLQDDLGSHRREKETQSPSVQIWHSLENIIDVAVPSRPMDLRFSSLESSTVPISELCVEMQDFIGQCVLCSPDSVPTMLPPLTLRYKDQTYTLDTFARVRSSMHDTPDLPVTIEEVTDYESNQRVMQCLINCFDTSSPRDWEAFVNSCAGLNSNGEPGLRGSGSV